MKNDYSRNEGEITKIFFTFVRFLNFVIIIRRSDILFEKVYTCINGEESGLKPIEMNRMKKLRE